MQQQQKPIPGATIIIAAMFFGFAWAWKSVMGDTAADQFYIYIFQGLGVATIFVGVIDFAHRRRLKWARKRAEEPTDLFGNADFATEKQCREAGLTDPHGLYLGLMPGSNTPLFHKGKAHLLTVAPARQGKGVGVVIPNLLHWTGSIFVTDPKGELAAVTARHRRETFGQEIAILNPWGLHGLPQQRYNPLQVLLDTASDPHYADEISDDAENLALQLLPEPEDQKNKYFRDGSRKILTALMLHLATRGDPASCTLPTMWRVLNNEARMKEMILEMIGSEAMDGLIADYGGDMKSRLVTNPDQFGDFMAGASQAVNIFKPGTPLGKAVAGTDIDLRRLKRSRASIYLVIPQERIGTHGVWMGLVTRQAITAVSRTLGAEKVLFLLDEFANMGRLTSLSEALTVLPGLGVRVWAFVQELAEIKRIYGEHTHETLLSQAEVKQFFAVNNLTLAKILSDAMGKRTVKKRSYNMGRTEDDQIGESLDEVGVPLMSPDEIRQMGREEQLLFIETLPPIRARRVPFWFISPWQDQVDRNPIEGDYPKPEPILTLVYREKGRGQGT